MKNKGILTVISGFSGAGKGTLMRALLTKYPEEYALSISVTTRAPRPGETDGVSYFFITEERFREMAAGNELIEYASYVEHHYGTPRAYVEEKLAEGKNVLLEIELQGAMQVKKAMPETVLLFITPPDADTLRERLIGRGTETMEVIEKRLARAAQEAREMGFYDYIVVNDQLDACVEAVHGIIQSEHFRRERRDGLIRAIQADVQKFEKGE